MDNHDSPRSFSAVKLAFFSLNITNNTAINTSIHKSVFDCLTIFRINF